MHKKLKSFDALTKEIKHLNSHIGTREATTTTPTTGEEEGFRKEESRDD